MATMVEQADAVGVGWASFEEFVEARRHALWRQAWLLTHDVHQAEDLVQTALVKCYPRFEALNGPGSSFEAYVRKVLHTTGLSWWRRRWTGEVPTETVGEHGETALDGPASMDLARALQALPRAQRAVIVLRYVEDLTEAETAATLGISTGTVKSHASRALAALRRSHHLLDEETR